MRVFDSVLAQLTFANQLTMLRLAAVPALAMALLYGSPALALVIFVAACITDRLDGIAARRLGQQTALGAFLDPVADKLLMLVTYVILSMPDRPQAFEQFYVEHHIPSWLTVLVVLRDVLIGLGSIGFLLFDPRRMFSPTRLGKWTTGFEMVTGGIFLTANVWTWFPEQLLWTSVVCTGTLVVVSGLQYLRKLGQQSTQTRTERNPAP